MPRKESLASSPLLDVKLGLHTTLSQTVSVSPGIPGTKVQTPPDTDVGGKMQLAPKAGVWELTLGTASASAAHPQQGCRPERLSSPRKERCFVFDPESERSKQN